MSDNYKFLKNNEYRLYELVTKVETLYSKKDYELCVSQIRLVLEFAIKSLCEQYGVRYFRLALNDYSNNLFSNHLNSDEYEAFQKDFNDLKVITNYSHHVNNHKKITYTQEEVKNLLDRLCYFVVDYFKLKYKEKVPAFEYIFPEQKSDSEIEEELNQLKQEKAAQAKILIEQGKKIAEKDNIINNVEDMTEKIKAEMQKEFSTQITSMQQSISELQKQRNQDQENFKKIVSDKISQLENMKKELQEYKESCINDIKNIFEETIAKNIKQEDKTEENYFYQGYANYMNQEYDKAEKFFNIAIENNSNVTYSYYYLACIAEINDDISAAIDYYTHAIDISPNEPLYYNARANAYYNSKQYELAASDWEKVLSLVPNYCIDDFCFAYAESEIDKNEEAKEHYTIFIKNNPNSQNLSAAYNNRGLIYGEQEEYESAIKDYDKAIRLNDTTSLYYSNRAETYYWWAESIRNEDCETSDIYYKNAVDDWNRALEFDENHEIDYFGLAYAESEIDKNEEAKEHYTIFIENNPDSDNLPYAYNNRGLIYKAQKDYEHAIDDFNKVINIDNTNSRYFNNRAKTYYAWSKSIEEEDSETAIEYYSNAVNDWNETLNLNKEYKIDYFRLASAEDEIGLYDEAIEHYTTYLENNSDSIIKPALNNRGCIYYKQKDYENAIKDYNAAIKQNDKIPLWYNNRAEAYYAWAESIYKEDYETAQEYYQNALNDWNEALEIDSEYEINYLGLAWTEWLVDKSEETEKHLDYFIENNPDIEKLSKIYEENDFEFKLESYKIALGHGISVDDAAELLSEYSFEDVCEALEEVEAEAEAKEAETVENEEGVSAETEEKDYFDLAYNSTDDEEKEKYYTIFIDNNPDSDDLPAAYNNRGNIYERQENYKNAIEDYNKAIKLNNNKPLYFDNRAEAYYKWAESIYDEEYEIAVKYYKKAVADWNEVVSLDENFEINDIQKEDAENEIELYRNK